MWELEALQVPNPEAEGVHYLIPGEHGVGRSDGESSIKCIHQSISRKHAHFTVGQGESGPPKVTLTDCSRYGTLVNQDKLVKAEKILSNLPQPIQVQFGFKHRFRLQHKDICIALVGTVEESVSEEHCRKLGIRKAESWNRRCTHLLAPAFIVLSPIVAAALTFSQHVITAAWLQAWVERKQLNSPAPDPAAFTPTIRHQSDPEVDSAELSAKDLAALAKAGENALLSGLRFAVSKKVEEKPEVEALVRAAGGTLFGDEAGVAEEEAVQFLGNQECVPPGCQVWTNTNRMLVSLKSEDKATALLRGSKQGLLVYNPVTRKQQREPVAEQPVASKKARGKEGTVVAAAAKHDLQTLAAEGRVAAEDDDMTDAEDEDVEVEEAAPSRKNGFATPHSATTVDEPLEGASILVLLPLAAKDRRKEVRSASAQSNGSVNFKAFNRKTIKHRDVIKTHSTVPGIVIDTTAFLSEQKLLRQQRKVADDLFAAQVKPKKPSAAATARAKRAG